MRPASREAFFAAYPDGKLVSIVRDPRAWYASARRQRQRDADPEVGIERWRRSAERTLEAIELHGDRVVAAHVRAARARTEATMRALADRIGISMSPTLLVPTFNGGRSGRTRRIGSTATAFSPSGWTPSATRSTRRRSAAIDELAGDLYDRVRGSAAAL